MRNVVWLFTVVLCMSSVGCSNSDSGKPVKDVEEPSAVNEASRAAGAMDSIGSAWLKEDGTIVLQLRAEGPAGIVGDALLTYERSDPDYQKTLDHIGGLEPGQTKPIPPWPDNVDKRK